MTDNFETTPKTGLAQSDWQAKYLAYVKRCAEVLPGNKAALFDALAVAGVTHVLVCFDGCGDSGQIEYVEAKAGDQTVAMPDADIEIVRAVWDEPEPQQTMLSVAAAVEQLVYDFLAETHDGWENNDGACGEFTFDVAARTIRLDFNQRYSASEHSQHIFRRRQPWAIAIITRFPR
jgi:hypothetical protein